MIHDAFVYGAIVWAALLLAWSVGLLVRDRDPATRIAVLDMLSLILIAMLVLFGLLRKVTFYFDAALGLAVLSFVGTLAFARFHARGRLF